MTAQPDIENAWQNSRSGARAGAGFRFQDAAATLALTLSWCAKLPGNAITPESLDDFGVEAANDTIWVQAKSKMSPIAEFRPREIVEIVQSGPGGNDDSRIVLLDRAFLEVTNTDWCRPLDSVARETILNAIPEGADRAVIAERLTHTTIVSIRAPIVEAIKLISEKLGVPEGAASLCAASLLHQMGQRASENARRTFRTRSSMTVGDVGPLVHEILTMVDSGAIEQAFREGLAGYVSFLDPIDDPQFYSGVSVRPGHVAAGLVHARDNEVDVLAEALFSGRHLLVSGPSGSGKSALCYLTAFATRHALRWIEVSPLAAPDRATLLRSIIAQRPTNDRPVVLYLDDIGRGADTTWSWIVDQCRRFPGIRVVGSVREEDLGVLPALDRVQVHRPTLTENLAEAIWSRLHDQKATHVAFWREAFEQSEGLLLEFTHILTRGGRLEDVIFEQVRRRVAEGREKELLLLQVASGAGMYGARVSAEQLKSETATGDQEFSLAMLRLRNEHLIGTDQRGEISGLHELRSRAIFRACQTLLSLNPTEMVARSLRCTTSGDTRRFAVRAMRDGTIDGTRFVSEAATNIAASGDIRLLIGALEAIRLLAYEADADVFKRITEESHLGQRQHFVMMVFMNADLAESLAQANPLFGKLNDVRKRFAAERSSDLRHELILRLDPSAINDLCQSLQSHSEVVSLFTALHSADLSAIPAALLDKSISLVRGASTGAIAEFLAILYDSDPTLHHLVSGQLGTSDERLDRLWRETPWALPPRIERDASGVNVEADLLAVEGELASAPDHVVYDYATRAVHLVAEATTVTSRPVLVSGDPIEIGGYSRGLKKLSRAMVLSRAAVAWNRILMHAVAQRFGAVSRTEVLERQKFAIEQLAASFEAAVDRVCRGRSIDLKTVREAQALELLEDIMPPPPIGAPEEMIESPLSGQLTDAAGTLIVDVCQAVQSLAKPSSTGAELALAMEQVCKLSVDAMGLDGWSYLRDGPLVALRRIEDTARSFGRVACAIGKRSLTDGSFALPKGRKWGQGRGIERATHLVERRWAQECAAKADELAKVLGAEVLLRRPPKEDFTQWPAWHVAIIAGVDDPMAFLIWVAERESDLKAIAESGQPTEVAPRIRRQVVPQLALSITRYGNFPSPEFEPNWRDLHPSNGWFRSQVLEEMRVAEEALLSAYAAEQLLGARELHDEEEKYIDQCGRKLGAAVDFLTASSLDGSQSAELALHRIRTLVASIDSHQSRGSAAVERLAKLQGLMLGQSHFDDEALESAAVVFDILSIDLSSLE